MRVLVTGSAGDIAQNVASILFELPQVTSVIGSDLHHQYFKGPYFQKTCILPRASDDEYFNKINQLISEEKIAAIFPISEAELRLFSANPDLLNQLPCKSVLTSFQAMSIGFDKLKTARFLESIGLPTPWTYLYKELQNGVPEYPCILKSREGSGSANIAIIDSEHLAEAYNTIYPDYIWQEYLPDYHGEYTCGIYRCSNGLVRVIVFRRRLSSGLTSYAEVVNKPEITALCRRLANELNLYGSMNIQLRYNKFNQPVVFEINPRFSSTVGMRHKAGFCDVSWSFHEQVLNQNIPNCSENWPELTFARSYVENTI